MSVFSFPPVIGAKPKVLILGSMPGVQSLKANQYYAHPRNAFWKIMSRIFLFEFEQSYSLRCQHLVNNQIAIWDVLKSCDREGSLDASIQTKTMMPNDIHGLIERNPSISMICFNGAKSADVYQRFIKKNDSHLLGQLKTIKLPSTSPAHAAMSFEQKLEAWRTVLENV